MLSETTLAKTLQKTSSSIAEKIFDSLIGHLRMTNHTQGVVWRLFLLRFAPNHRLIEAYC
ncbi:hypothetical protein SynBIOSU31_01530 [Synechococcus sp. BIOS-U3-1]|nr:hypothetical protein SynBIOSU31_01530 [Synechococcus sp. BIOS-U3-1]